MCKDIYFISDIGLKRERNEDAINVFYNEDVKLIALADGMGGHPFGNVASKMVIEYLGVAFRDFNTKQNLNESASWLKKVYRDINSLIRQESENEPMYKGMGTTFICALINKDYILISNVGDSRAYYLNSLLQLKQITDDHTLVAELFRQGEISEKELITHPSKNILMQAIGTEDNIDVDLFTIQTNNVVKLLLCTDGLTDMVSDELIEKSIKSTGNIENISNSLIKIANDNGGKDNISIAIWENPLMKGNQ